MPALRVVTAPAQDAATLIEVKEHLRVDTDDENAYITRLIAAATAHVEAHTGRRLVTQTVDWYPLRLPSVLELPTAPVQSVTEIEVTTDTGAVTVPAADYSLVSLPGIPLPFIELAPDAAYPAADTTRALPYRVRLVVGYGAAAADVPEGLRQAIYILAAGWYEARQDWVQGGQPGQYGAMVIGGILSGAFLSDTLLDQYRLMWVA